MTGPEQVNEPPTDDVQDIEVSLDALVAKFILPIERLRSHAAPNTLKERGQTGAGATVSAQMVEQLASSLGGSSFNQNEPQESRTHAFYRMLGLPVISSLAGFYNPGFNPIKSTGSVNNRIQISSNVDQNIIVSHTTRETSAKTRKNIFKTEANAAVYSVGMLIPKKFQVISTDKTFTDIDEQKFVIPLRKSMITSIYSNVNGSEITNTFDTGVHILRPFCVDPTIADTVQPAEKMVCEPFLSRENDTKLEGSKKLLRPGLELILRLRLAQQPTDEDAIANTIIFTLDPDQNIEGLSRTEIKDLVSALLAENKIQGAVVGELTGITAYEINQLNQSIKTIKALIKKLIDSISIIAQAMIEIEWHPKPGEKGPEDFGSFTNDGALRYKIGKPELEQRILNLEFLAEQSKYVGNPAFELSDYAISTFESVKKNFDEELGNAQGEKKAHEQNAGKALSAIEYITGEISGLGLVDILAIYAAMWAIDIDVLLSLIDNAAFDRLYGDSGIVSKDKSLRNPAVENRKNDGPRHSGFDALGILEAQIISILAFADAEYLRRLRNQPVQESADA